MTYKSLDDIIRDARTIKDKLSDCGENDAARDLNEALNHPWTFASEALVEIGLALEDVRSTHSARLSEPDVELLDRVISGAKDLFESA